MTGIAEEPVPILLVEDDSGMAILEKRALVRAGLRVEHAASIAAANALLHEREFSVILLDYHLPDGDAWEVVELAHAKIPPTPVVLVTAMGSERVAVEALKRGVADYVSKQDGFWDGLAAVALRVMRLAQAEAKLRRSENKFRTLVNHAPVAIFETDPEGRCTFVNETWIAVTGIPIESALGTGWAEALHPDDRARVFDAWNASVAAGKPFELDYRFRSPSGATAWVNGRAVALREPSGAVAGYLGTVVDVTERTLAAERVQRTLGEKEVLLREIHHRVKNNLQVIMSLVRLQSDAAPRAGALGLFDSTVGRIHAIALLHERLYRSPDLSQIGVHDYLTGLVRDVVSANGQDRIQVEIEVSPGELAFDLDTAMPMGLIVNELLTNAFKHAFPPSRPAGRVWIRVGRDGKQHEIVIEDDGIGFREEADPAVASTLGLQIVHSLSAQLDGSFRTERGRGARAVLTFPLSRGGL